MSVSLSLSLSLSLKLLSRYSLVLTPYLKVGLKCGVGLYTQDGSSMHKYKLSFRVCLPLVRTLTSFTQLFFRGPTCD